MVLWKARLLRRENKLANLICRSALLLAAALLLCLSSGASPAEAQFSPFNWFQQVFRPQRSYDYAPPRPHEHHAYRPRTVAKVVKPPAVPPTFFVAVLGDSLGQLLGQGLTTALSDRPEVEVLRDAKEDSGLVRDDYYDWPKAAHDLVASGQKINVAVMMIGSNDHQTLHDSTGSYDPGTPQYQQIYSARIEAVAKIFHDAKIPLLWVGLPVMKTDRFSTEMAALNDMYRQYASRNGATYIDTWEDFVDDDGQFSSYGPDVDGQVVRLRALDGVHFTKAGALKLASFVEPQIRDILNVSAPQDDAALAKIETTAPAGTNNPAAGAAVTPVKPPIGPILPLTGAGARPGRPARDVGAGRPQNRYRQSR
ncbi:MAG: SGNH family hydrolase [Methylovirgula sp.]